MRGHSTKTWQSQILNSGFISFKLSALKNKQTKKPEAESHVAKAAPQFTMRSKMTLNLSLSCLHFLRL